MKFPFYVARRYLFAKKSHNVINIISAISVIGVAVGTMGLIIVLSVFNGFGNLVISLYDTFDPDIKITARMGKTFDPIVVHPEEIKKIKGVRLIAPVLEESVLIKYNDRQYIAIMKGVSNEWMQIASLDSNIIDGSLLLQNGDTSYAVLGGSIAYSLGLNLNDPFSSLHLYSAQKEIGNSVTNSESFNEKIITPSGVFAIQQDFDAKYILVPLAFARELTGNESKISALELSIDPGANPEEIFTSVQKVVGPEFWVKDRVQQHDFLYKILKSEKWAVYLILTFILLIAAFNTLGSLAMLIIDKKEDIYILKSLGASDPVIRKIFLLEGLMISLTGGITGLLLGAALCYCQQRFEVIKLENAESFVIDAYPVAMQLMDFISVFLVVFIIGFAAAWFSSRMVMKKSFSFK